MTSILHKEYAVKRDEFSSAGKVSSDIKRTLSTIGIDATILRRIAVASYEAEINMIIHAYGGKVELDVFDNGNVQIIFNDEGPGIPDVEKAMTPGFSTANQQARELGFGAGMGLPNMKRVSDIFDLKTSKDGTIITMTFNGGI